MELSRNISKFWALSAKFAGFQCALFYKCVKNQDIIACSFLSFNENNDLKSIQSSHYYNFFVISTRTMHDINLCHGLFVKDVFKSNVLIEKEFEICIPN